MSAAATLSWTPPVAARHPGYPAEAVTLRAAAMADAPAIAALLMQDAAEARLLPRHASDIAAHAARFVVAVHGAELVACADLVPLGRGTAEVRSLVVAPRARRAGIGSRVLDEIVTAARLAGHARLCAFTHAPAWFVTRGFHVVPHAWVPEKLTTDCRGCGAFGRCGQAAVVRTLDGRTP